MLLLPLECCCRSWPQGHEQENRTVCHSEDVHANSNKQRHIPQSTQVNSSCGKSPASSMTSTTKATAVSLTADHRRSFGYRPSPRTKSTISSSARRIQLGRRHSSAHKGNASRTRSLQTNKALHPHCHDTFFLCYSLFHWCSCKHTSDQRSSLPAVDRCQNQKKKATHMMSTTRLQVRNPLPIATSAGPSSA